MTDDRPESVPLCGACVTVATAYADLARPVAAVAPAVPDELVTLLRAGLTDAAIARRLGRSHRTVVRHVGRLMHDHNVSTRFALGYVLGRRDGAA